MEKATAIDPRELNKTKKVEDSGTEVERRPLPGSNPVMSGFCLWDVFHTNGASTG